MRKQAEEFEKKFNDLNQHSMEQAKEMERIRREQDDQGKEYKKKEDDLIATLQEDVRFLKESTFLS